MTLENELKNMIIKELKLTDIKPDEINEKSPLFGEGLGLDSLDAVELVVLLQKHYQVEIKDMVVAREAFATLKTLADYIRNNRKV